ncbi:neither inactivation nor afterpotential protein G [Condylostylus longicornis]|uniref:neither inactivation nor afterpotential protein G n=1 Tax=Condylostylus longicornis TaxID=2530218 RepID=UPI00244DB07D|nr:neither inactivation nor afterpotential protein G [Condylostylus longicornis]
MLNISAHFKLIRKTTALIMGILRKRNISKILSIIVAIASIVFVIWNKCLNENIPNLVKDINEINLKEFDYIIVGAGTAGSVVASTLSANSNYSVLLIEAGSTFNILTSSVPIFATLLQKSNNDWNLLTVPQKYSSKAIYEQRQCLPRGKGLGGSSQMNFMLHFGGHKKDFDIWKKCGLTDWDYETIQKYLNEFDNFNSSHYQNLPPQKNHNSRTLDIWKIPKNYSKLSESFENLQAEFRNENLNFHFTEYTIKNGIRSNVYQKFLRPSFKFENLKILINAYVDKINFDKNKRASSVNIKMKDQDGTAIKVLARKEIIISAGAYLTPGILQRSGIGSKHLLRKLNIQMIHESPKVGENLYDHMTFPLFVSIKERASATIDKILSSREIWKYITTGEGYFGNIGVIGTISSSNESFGINIFGAGSVDERFLMEISNFKENSFRSVFPLYYNTSQEGFVVLTSCYQLKSRGNIKINSTNPFDPPLINPNYLKEKYDIDCMIKGVRTAVRIIESKSFQQLKPKIHWAKNEECKEYGPTTKDFITNQPSDKYLECLMREVALNSHHPGGSCSIETLYDKTSPLDQYFKVKGVEGLRVVDASILPTPISGTPNSVLIAIAKRAAHLILD